MVKEALKIVDEQPVDIILLDYACHIWWVRISKRSP